MPKHQPITFVLFGATGNLAQKKIVPALLHLFSTQKLPDASTIVVFSRRPWTDVEYHSFILPSLQKLADKETIENFFKKLVYVQGIFDTDASFINLKNILDKIDAQIGGETEKIYHLAIQPEFYADVAQGLGSQKLLEGSNKLLIEKPFGNDLASAKLLEEKLEAVISEERIYRIDHYLGKAGLWNIVENILDSKINNADIKKIEVRLHEKIGIEGRGEFYESVGVVRDVVENHCLVMLAFALNGPDSNLNLEHLQPGTLLERGQYEGYLQEEDVKPDSQTETYVKIESGIQDIEIVLEAGKKMKEKKSQVEYFFKDGSTKIFNIEEKKRTNGDVWPDAYEVVIEAGIKGDKKFFVSIDEVLASWKFVTPILQELSSVELKKY